MARNYSSEESDVRFYEYDTEALVAIGTIVRAFADIDSFLPIYIANLIDADPSKVAIILGRAAISAKIECAGHLAGIKSEKAKGKHNLVFNKKFHDLLRCRNDVAHGELIGINESDQICFATTEYIKNNESTPHFTIVAYTLDDLKRNAGGAIELLNKIKTELGCGLI